MALLSTPSSSSPSSSPTQASSSQAASKPDYSTTSLPIPKQHAAPFRLYPHDQLEQLRRLYPAGSVKRIHLVRHAEGTHNVQSNYKEIVDAELTENGRRQCQQLASQELLRDSTSLYCVTSTMTRCIQTALWSFPTQTLFAMDGIRETVNYNCDRRRSIAELSRAFPMVQFDSADPDVDPIWAEYMRRNVDVNAMKESMEIHKVIRRGRAALRDDVWKDEYDQMLVCTHSAFLHYILHWGQYETPWYVPKLIPSQKLDERTPEERETEYGTPIFQYCSLLGDKSAATFREEMWTDYANCEMRSCCIVRVVERDTSTAAEGVL